MRASAGAMRESQESDAEAMPTETDEAKVERCAVCGATVEVGDISDTSGWRWYSDGRGGLHALCPTCPPPDDVS